MAIARLSLAAGMMLILAGGVQAGEEMHHHGRHMDKEMERQHRLMGSYAIAQAKITAALERRDAATVEAETRKLLATIPDLKRAKPHKNLKLQKVFLKIASAFEADVKKTNALGKKADLSGAKAAFAAAQKRCDECHAKFRD